MSDTFAARADAIFGALGESAQDNGWHLDTAQGFKPGADDALERDSSDDEAQEPEPQSLPGADDSDEEQTYKLKASSCYRRAFEREEEEDEFDRVAAGTDAEDSKPTRTMEVLEDNMFDRMHSQRYKPVPTEAAAATTQHQQPMELDDEVPPLETPSLQQPKQHVQDEQQPEQGHRIKRQKPSEHVWVPPHRRPDHRPLDATGDVQDHSSNQQQQLQQHPQQQQRQQRNRSVRFAGHTCAVDDHQPQHQQQQRQGWGRGAAGRGLRGGGRRGQGSVPDHVRNPHKYTVYTFDEPIYVGQGDKDPAEIRAMQRGMHGVRNHDSGRNGSRIYRAEQHDSNAAAGSDSRDHGRWQDDADEAPMMLDGLASSTTADYQAGGPAPAEQPAVNLPPAGGIKFQPSRGRTLTQHSAGTWSVPNPVSTAGHTAGGAVAGASTRPASTLNEPKSVGRGVFLEETAAGEDAPEHDVSATSASAARSKSSRQRQYRSKAASDDE